MNSQDLVRSDAQMLQDGSKPLAQSLLYLNRACLQGRLDALAWRACEDAVVAALPSREHAQRLLAAHGKTCWPGSMGQSPYGEIFDLVRLALAGQVHRRAASLAEQAIHALLFERLAPAAARARVQLDGNGRERRYARLLFCMRETAILTTGEADAVLRQLLKAHPSERAQAFPACEAAANFGGNARVIEQVMRRRASLREMRARALAT
jgi:hypothetical protein